MCGNYDSLGNYFLVLNQNNFTQKRHCTKAAVAFLAKAISTKRHLFEISINKTCIHIKLFFGAPL